MSRGRINHRLSLIPSFWLLHLQRIKIMGVQPKIAPSMLSSDFANLASEAQRMLDCGADWLHMDIMVIPSPFSPILY